VFKEAEAEVRSGPFEPSSIRLVIGIAENGPTSRGGGSVLNCCSGFKIVSCDDAGAPKCGWVCAPRALCPNDVSLTRVTRSVCCGARSIVCAFLLNETFPLCDSEDAAAAVSALARHLQVDIVLRCGDNERPLPAYLETVTGKSRVDVAVMIPGACEGATVVLTKASLAGAAVFCGPSARATLCVVVDEARDVPESSIVARQPQPQASTINVSRVLMAMAHVGVRFFHMPQPQ
jgi:hypothetical protein